MPIKTYRPTTPGRRSMTGINYKKILTKKRPEKSLLVPLKRHSGRDRFGHISVRHQGGGAKRQYRLISSLQDRLGAQATIRAIEYDPNRSAFIALMSYEDGKKAYILAPHGLKINDTVIGQDKTPIKNGNRLKLKNIPIGIGIYDIEMIPGSGGKLVRSAGSSAQIAALAEGEGRKSQYVQVKLASGEIRLIHGECFASIGVVSNLDHASITIGKAGRSRWMGVRPSVRGSVMAPSDHPHGGGEGKSPIGLKHPKTPWGKPTLGYKTRRNRRTDRFIIKRKKN